VVVDDMHACLIVDSLQRDHALRINQRNPIDWLLGRSRDQ
jgi:hypothetical protein